MPESAPTISGNWSAVVAFTNLTFTNAIGVTYVPGTSKLVVWEREGRIWSFTNHPSANSKTLYLNGALVASQLTTFSAYSSADRFSVGAAVLDSTGNYFRGAIDEVALFDKALTASQIRTLYSAATNGPAQLRIQQFNNPVVLTWPYGTLQSSYLPQGVYTNVPGGLSPYTNAINSPQKFFRLRID